MVHAGSLDRALVIKHGLQHLAPAGAYILAINVAIIHRLTHVSCRDCEQSPGLGGLCLPSQKSTKTQTSIDYLYSSI